MLEEGTFETKNVSIKRLRVGNLQWEGKRGGILSGAHGRIHQVMESFWHFVAFFLLYM